MTSVAGVKVENFMPNLCSTLGESPHWDDKTGKLILVDIRANTVLRLDVTTKQVERIVLADYTSMIVPSAGGGYIVTQSRKLCHLDWETEKLTDIAEIPLVSEDNKLNDGKCDAKGRLWIGSMGGFEAGGAPVPGKGGLYKLEKGQLTEAMTPFDLSNGLGWSKDSKTMYLVDSLPSRCVNALDFDIESGVVSKKRALIDFNTLEYPGFPDGMCIDENGNIWAASFAGSKITQFDAKDGKVMRTIDIPAKNVTSCCFGGKDYSELYVTTAVKGEKGEDVHAGSLFRVTGLGVRGTPANIYSS